MKKILKKCVMSLAVGITTFMMIGNQAKAIDQAYRAPGISGATESWIYKGEEFDTSKTMVFADDLEDGDLTDKMQVAGEVNTEVAGEYPVTYQVTDSDGNTTTLNTRVRVLEDTASEEDKVIKRTLYTLPDAHYLTDINFNRGYYHDRQSLGIWIPADAQLEIRLVNGEEFQNSLKLDFMNQDRLTESSVTIPASGEWITVENSFAVSESEKGSRDSVPFIVTPKNTTVQPVIEYKWNNQFQEIPYYRYHSSEEAFFAAWRENNAPYGIIEGSAATFLVPIKDREEILNSSYANREEYGFQTIDEMLEWYGAFVKQYDEYAGLDFYAQEPYNQNIRSKFFIKANENGWGQAYYTVDHSAYNGDSLDKYLTRHWLSLHEFGHGYEGNIATMENPFVETTNNIMGYYFEETYRPADDEGWLLERFYGTKEERQAALEKKALERRSSTSSFGGIVAGAEHYDVSLYMFVNALDKVGPKQAVSAMHTQYRKDYYLTGKRDSSSDVIVKTFGESGGYNMVPYFETYHIHPSEKVEGQIYKEDAPMVYYLKDILPEDAKIVKDQLGLSGEYSLVTTDELGYTGYTSQVEFQIKIDDMAQLQGKQILIKNGKEVVKRLPVTGERLQTELPVGIYEIELPAPRNQEYDFEDGYLIASKGNIVKEINYVRELGNPLADDEQINLLGLSDAVFATAKVDTVREKLIWRTENTTPHSYIEDTYAAIRVLNSQGEPVYEQTIQGNTELEENYQELDFPIGFQIEICHKEGRSRLQFSSRYTKETLNEFAPETNTEPTVYVMTEKGLMKREWDEARRNRVFLSILSVYSQSLVTDMTQGDLHSPNRYHKEKLCVQMAYDNLDENSKELYRKDWGILLGIETERFERFEKIPSNKMSVTADSQGNTEYATSVIDGDEETFWHTNYSGGVKPDLENDVNNSLTILLDEPIDIGKLEYVPRQDGGTNGIILAYDLYYSTTVDGEDFQKIQLKDSVWTEDARKKSVEFDTSSARRICIRARNTAGKPANTHISAAEFYLYEKYELSVSSGNIYLSSLYPVYDPSRKDMQKNKNGHGSEIILNTRGNQKCFTKGIGMLTDSTAVWNLEDKSFDTFEAYVGVDAAEPENHEAIVEIYGDGTLLYQSEKLKSIEPAEVVSIDIQNVEVLEIRATGEKETAVSLGDARFCISEDQKGITLKAGEQGGFLANMLAVPQNNGKIQWETTDAKIAAVSEDGTITANGVGIATVSAKSSEKTVACQVTVEKAEVEEIFLNQTELELKQGEVFKLEAKVAPSYATYQEISFRSQNETVALVDVNGLVRAVNEGNTLIEVVNTDSGKSAVCSVQITKDTQSEEPEKPEESEKPILPKPGRVTGIKISGNAKTTLRISWDSAAYTSNYQIWRAPKGSRSFIKVADTREQTYKDKGLRPGTSYVYKVRAGVGQDNIVYGDFSEEIWSTTRPNQIKLNKVKAGKRSVSITWKKDGKSQGYEVWMKAGKGKYKKIKVLSAKKIRLKITKLKTGKKYTFRVRAYRKDGMNVKIYGAYSKEKTVKVK